MGGTRQIVLLSLSIFVYFCVSGLRLKNFLFSRIDEFPILTSLQCHLAKQGVIALELSSYDLPEKINLGYQVRLHLQVVETDGREFF